MESSRKCGTGSGEVHQPALRYFNEMLFLPYKETPTQSRITIGIDEDEEKDDSVLPHFRFSSVLPVARYHSSIIDSRELVEIHSHITVFFLELTETTIFSKSSNAVLSIRI